MSLNYYYIVMSQKDMLQNQVLEEILRERANYYLAKKRDLDFWVLINPNFLNTNDFHEKVIKTQFFNQHKDEITDTLNSKFFSSLISFDKDFIKWIMLRLGYFENIYENELLNENNSRKSFVSDGIYGELTLLENNNLSISPLSFDKNFIHPKIITKKMEKSLEIYYSNYKNI